MAIKKDRKSLGMSVELYASIHAAALEVDLPMTRFLELVTTHWKDLNVNWKAEREQLKIERPNWATMIKNVEYYLEKYGDLTNEELMSYTGYGLASIEAITHTSHKRCIEVIKTFTKRRPGKQELSELANVTMRFAERMIGMYYGDLKPSEKERYLFEDTGRKRVTKKRPAPEPQD